MRTKFHIHTEQQVKLQTTSPKNLRIKKNTKRWFWLLTCICAEGKHEEVVASSSLDTLTTWHLGTGTVLY